MEFSGEKLTVKRLFNYLFGLFLITLGVAFSIKSNLGSTPVASVPYALNLIFSIELGVSTVIFHIILVIIELLLLKKDFKMKHFLQIPAGIVFGAFTTFSLALIGFIPTAPDFITALLMSVLSIFLIALGLFFYVPSNMIPLSVEGVTPAIAIVTGNLFSKTKVYFDISVVLTSLILSYLFLGNFGSVGIGTILSALFIGTTVKCIHKINYRLTGRDVNLKKM